MKEEVSVSTVVEYSNTNDETFLPQMIDMLDMDREYRMLMYIHEAAVEKVTAQLNILKGEFQFSNDRNPISSISSRIKSRESII